MVIYIIIYKHFKIIVCVKDRLKNFKHSSYEIIDVNNKQIEWNFNIYTFCFVIFYGKMLHRNWNVLIDPKYMNLIFLFYENI